jgi:hypothetical protein
MGEQHELCFRPGGAVFEVLEELGRAELREQRPDAPRSETGEELEGRARVAEAAGLPLTLADGRRVRLRELRSVATRASAGHGEADYARAMEAHE